MLFGFWQLKTTVLALLLASCLGHELLRTCERNSYYERSIARRNIETDNLRKLYGDQSRRADTAGETRNLDNISRGLRENRLDPFNSKSVSNREIRRELTNSAENRRDLVRHEPSRREPYQNCIEVDSRRVTADISDLNRRVDDTPKIQRSAIIERRQITNTDRFRTPISRLNERENRQEPDSSNDRLSMRQHELFQHGEESQARQERNELRDENHEPHRLSMRQQEVFQLSEESQAEREIRDLDRQSRRSNKRIFNSERNILQGSERISEERENRESRRSQPVQRRDQMNEESRGLNEVLTRREHETNRDVARREFENSATRRFNERISERAHEIRFERERERENDRNIDKSRRLTSNEDDLLDRRDSRLDERERNSHRSIEQLSERTLESIPRREESAQERDNRLEEVERSSSRLDLTERLTEQRENLRRLNQRESLDGNHRSIEQLSERRQEINRRGRTDNQDFGRFNSRLSAQRRLTEHESERSNEHLSNGEDRNERQHDLKAFDENRESRKPSQRIIEREERNVQRRIAIDIEREQNTERNVCDTENRRVTSRQDKRLTERKFTQLRVEDTRKGENNSRQPAITQQEQRSAEVFNRRDEQRSINTEFNRRQQHRYDHSPESENVLNRNRDSQRLIAVDEENVDNRDVNRLKSSSRFEQRNIHRLAVENRNSRRIDERREENGLLNRLSRRSSFSKNERELEEQLDISDSEFETRREELRELKERVDQSEINRALDRSVGEIQRSRVMIFENVENLGERDNQNLDEANRRLETRRSNERQDSTELTRNNHQMVLRKDETFKSRQRRDENKREQREEREKQRFDTLSNRNVENHRDFQFIVGEHKETPIDSLKSRNMAYVQGILLAIVIMKTLNGKNNIKCQVSQKFQEAIAMLGF